MNHLKNIAVPEKKKVEFFMKFSKEDIKNSISRLNDTIGYDAVHSKHLKFESELLVELLSNLFTSCYRLGFCIINF